MKTTLERPVINLTRILSDTVRCAPVLSALNSGQYDSFAAAGLSIRIRDTNSGYFRFVIGSAEDIAPLVSDIYPDIRFAIIVDDRCEDTWRDLLPEAEFKYFTLSVVTRDKFIPDCAAKLPEDCRIVAMDETWDDLVIGLCEDEEFTADILRAQLRKNLSLGLVCNDKRVGFISMHLNGEMGPIWVAPEYRKRGFGKVLAHAFITASIDRNPVLYTLSMPDNIASTKITESLGFQVFDKSLLHITM